MTMRSLLGGRFAVFAVALCLALAAAACGSSDSDVTTQPTPVTTTEAFSGTFSQLGSAFHSFSILTTGPVTASLTSVGPLATMSLGVGLANWDAATSTCGETAFVQNTDARAGATALKGSAVAGNYCVRVFDSGNVPVGGSVTYALELTHP